VTYHPNIVLSDTEFFFYECAVNDSKEFSFTIQNRNDYIPVKLEFEKVPQFNLNAKSLVLAPNETQELIIKFQPRNFGSFNQTMRIY